jgi:hypothetical protein
MTEDEVRALAEEDRSLYGWGFYRKKPDGTFEHIPANEVLMLLPLLPGSEVPMLLGPATLDTGTHHDP